MDQLPDWQSTINVNISDHEVRLQTIEAVLSKAVDFDAVAFADQGESLRQVQQYDLHTAPERQAARIDNHDQRLRAMEHRLMLMEIELRELCNAIKDTDTKATE